MTFSFVPVGLEVLILQSDHVTQTTSFSASSVSVSVVHWQLFSCRFYIESISYLKDNATIELFFLNAKSCIYKVRTTSPCLEFYVEI